jgi:hypothetical protein
VQAMLKCAAKPQRESTAERRQNDVVHTSSDQHGSKIGYSTTAGDVTQVPTRIAYNRANHLRDWLNYLRSRRC